MADGVTVSENDDGQRLDRWLKKHYPETSFGQMQKILRTGQVRVDGKRAKGETRLAAGQIVRIPPQMSSPVKTERGLLPKDEAFIQSLVIYQDEHIIALNKPQGIAVQGGSKITKHIDGLLEGLSHGGEKPHLVHRLDKDTSGVLLLARNSRAARELGEVFRGRDIRKYYWAVTAPAPMEEQGRIKSYLAKVGGAGDERMQSVDADNREGKSALTYYNVMERVGDNAAWVAFWPKTGRTHQIRVHAAENGMPLLGDYKYYEDQHFLAENADLPRVLHLHARRVIMRHPMTGKKIDITAPLGPEMRKTFKYFGFSPDDKSDPFEDVD